MPTTANFNTIRCLSPVPSLALGLALALCLSGPAHAQLDKDAQKCVNEVNKNFAKVAKTLGKDICACIKDAAKGKLTDPNTIEECLLADRKGKYEKATIKLAEKLAKKCDLYDPNFPTVDPSDPNAIIQAAEDKELALIHTIFGPDLDAVIVIEADPNNPDSKDESKCQQAIAKQAKKCQDTKLKVFVKCKKDAFKGKLGAPPTSASELQDACLGVGIGSFIPDPKGKIEKDCDTKLVSTFTKKCADLTAIDSLFDCGSGLSATSLRDCVDAAVECEVCTALNAVDGLARDCDEFDDGEVNGSCGGTAPADCGDTFPTCDGDCTTVGFVCSDVGGVCVCGPPACGDTLPPTCGGDCPPGDVCTDLGASCACLTPPPPACGTTFPLCDGDCPPTETCTDVGGSCTCLPPLPPCSASAPPMCAGDCAGGDTCVDTGAGCTCIGGGGGFGPCSCGTSCLYDCGPFGGVITGFCVVELVSPPGACSCSALCPGLPPECGLLCTSAPCSVHCPGGGTVAGECEFTVTSPPAPEEGCLCTNLGPTPPCP